jgi:hypothetical protein
VPGGEIAITSAIGWSEPLTNSTEDRAAAERQQVGRTPHRDWKNSLTPFAATGNLAGMLEHEPFLCWFLLSSYAQIFSLPLFRLTMAASIWTQRSSATGLRSASLFTAATCPPLLPSSASCCCKTRWGPCLVAAGYYSAVAHGNPPPPPPPPPPPRPPLPRELRIAGQLQLPLHPCPILCLPACPAAELHSPAALHRQLRVL